MTGVSPGRIDGHNLKNVSAGEEPRLDSSPDDHIPPSFSRSSNGRSYGSALITSDRLVDDVGRRLARAPRLCVPARQEHVQVGIRCMLLPASESHQPCEELADQGQQHEGRLRLQGVSPPLGKFVVERERRHRPERCGSLSDASPDEQAHCRTPMARQWRIDTRGSSIPATSQPHDERRVPPELWSNCPRSVRGEVVSGTCSLSLTVGSWLIAGARRGNEFASRNDPKEGPVSQRGRGGANVTATSDMLRDLLITKPTYRRQWLAKVERPRSTELNLAAVAKVLTEYLWESGERDDQETTLARGLRDRVRRALNGEKLTAETLTWFVQAFHMDNRDEHRLWRAFVGGGGASGVAHTIRKPRAMVKRQWHRTQALFERYFFGEDGSLRERRTMHTILALEDGVDSYLFNHEPFATRIDVRFGGTLGRHYEYGDGLVSDDIVLERPLVRGESICLEYWTSYAAGRHLPVEVRRPARARTENVDIALQFHTLKLPRSIWWAVWADHYDGSPVNEEPIALTAEHTAHRFTPFVEQTVVGFRWEW